jgi:hypothetical protein
LINIAVILVGICMNLLFYFVLDFDENGGECCQFCLYG